jgi:hypothetical protein
MVEQRREQLRGLGGIGDRRIAGTARVEGDGPGRGRGGVAARDQGEGHRRRCGGGVGAVERHLDGAAARSC